MVEKIGILGTGLVGQTIASKLVSLGYNVMIGTRDRVDHRQCSNIYERVHTSSPINSIVAVEKMTL
ncbi:MAG: NAD(P)-binding domain-containing protein [Bacteroidota bacterium]